MSRMRYRIERLCPARLGTKIDNRMMNASRKLFLGDDYDQLIHTNPLYAKITNTLFDPYEASYLMKMELLND